MSREEEAIRLTRIMRDVFDADDLQYDDNLAVDAIEGWTSLGHMRLVSAVENDFGIQFTSGEIDSFRSARDLLDAILRRSAAQ